MSSPAQEQQRRLAPALGSIAAVSFSMNGSVTVNRTGLISNTGTGAAQGIVAQTTGTGAINITNTGGVNIAGTGSTAIRALHIGTGVANVVVNGAGAINSTGTGVSIGINAENQSAGIIDVDSGAITLNAASTGTGINAVSAGGSNVSVNNAGAINGGARGISATSVGTGTVTVGVDAAIGDATMPTLAGVQTSAVDGATVVTANAVVSSAGNGFNLTSTGAGTIVLNANSDITAGTDGVAVSSNTGQVDLNIAAGQTLRGANQAIFGTSGGGAAINIMNNGTIGQMGPVASQGLINTITSNVAVSGFVNNGTWFAQGGASTIQANTQNSGSINLVSGNVADVINISGDFTQSTGGSLSVDVDAAGGNADQINVTGIASLAGTVDVNFTTGDPISQTTILTATGSLIDNGITIGTVTGAVNPLTSTQLIANSNNLVVDVFLNGALGNFNSNQTSTINSVNNGGSPTILGTLIGLPTVGQTQQALDQLGGEIFLNEETATLSGAGAFTDQLFSCQVAGEVYSAISEGSCLWLRPQGKFHDQDSTSTNIGFEERVFGLSLGGQVELKSDWYAGFALGIDTGSLSAGNGASSDRTAYHGGFSLKHVAGNFSLAGAITGGLANFETTRTLAFAGATNTSDHDVTYVSARLRAAHLWEQDDLYIKPLVDLDFTYLDREGFNESGNAATALVVQGGSESIFSVSPAIEFGMERQASENLVARAYGKIGTTFYSDLDHSVTASFAGTFGAAPTFSNTTGLDDTFIDLEAGVTFLEDDKATFQLGYQGRFSDNSSQSSVFAKINFEF